MPPANRLARNLGRVELLAARADKAEPFSIVRKPDIRDLV